MKIPAFVAALAVASAAVSTAMAAEQPPLTTREVEQTPVEAGRRALAQLGDQVVDAERPFLLPVTPSNRLDQMVVSLTPHGSGVGGLCERQELRIAFEPTPEGHATLAATHPSRLSTADPAVRARTVAVENHYKPLPGYVAGKGAGASADDDAACAKLEWRTSAVRARSAWEADQALALFDRIQAQVKEGRLQFNFRCTLDGSACPDPSAAARLLLSGRIERVNDWFQAVEHTREMVSATLSGSFADGPREWRAEITALDGFPTYVQLHVSHPAPA